MSTSEQWTSEFSPCPCGKGKILQDWDSPDNPWSRTTVTFRLDCQDCSAQWVLDDNRLHNRAAYEADRQAWDKYYAASKELDRASAAAVESIVAAQSFADPKAEYLFLKRAGVCSEGPIRYKRFRVKGRPVSEMCSPTRNLDWVARLLPDPLLKDQIGALRDEMNRLQMLRDDAKKRFATIRVDSLKTRKPEGA